MDTAERQRLQVRNVPVLGPDHEARLRGILAQFLDRSEADEVLLVDRGGVVLASQGQQPALAVDSIGALAAGSFAATRALAARVGEREFSALYHQGANHHILMQAVIDVAILVAIFSSATTVGMVRLVIREAAKDVGALIEDVLAVRASDLPDITFSAADINGLNVFDEREEAPAPGS